MKHYILILLVMFFQLSCNKDNTGVYTPYPDHNIPSGVYNVTHSCSMLGSKNSIELVTKGVGWGGYQIENFAGVGGTLKGGWINGRKIEFSSNQTLGVLGITVISCKGSLNSINHITSLTYRIRDNNNGGIEESCSAIYKKQ